ncbi:hypothetical protein FGG08_006850, partial [Glutinoglossum americanum]
KALDTSRTATMLARTTSQPPANTSSTFTPFVAVPAHTDPAVPAEHTEHTESSAAATLSLPMLLTVQADSPLTLAAHTEQLLEKSSGALVDLAHMPRLRGVRLRSDRTIIWDRVGNQEAVLGYTRGLEASTAWVLAHSCAVLQYKANSWGLALIVTMVVEALDALSGLTILRLQRVANLPLISPTAVADIVQLPAIALRPVPVLQTILRRSISKNSSVRWKDYFAN